ncbi:MAG: hypothetical protein ATN31_07690 [Candidatus Epulonipiscioides saccharophilum]|nr:MAG: hypothetical protein ATN31_07690 [Epulopiscium sp. AS2M-Bin001]
MKFGKRIFALLLAGSLLSTATPAQTLNLPAEIEIDVLDFETLDDVATKYKTEYYNLVNSDDRLIQRVDFLAKEMDVEGSVTIDIPEDIAKVVRFFEDLKITGSMAKNLKVSVINPEGKKFAWKGSTSGTNDSTTMTMDTSNLDSAGIGLENPLLVVGDDSEPIYKGYKLLLEGTGSLKNIFLFTDKGVSENYDVSTWSILGEDKPILDISVDVDITKMLNIDGETKLDENKFKRIHMGSGPTNSLSSSTISSATNDLTSSIPLSEYGFFPGRGTIQFSVLEKYNGIHADINKPGYTNMAETKKDNPPSQGSLDLMNRLYPFTGEDYVITYDMWPSWTWEDPKVNAGKGTPALEHFDAAAQLSADMLKQVDEKFLGYGPKYIEVKNESSLRSEWAYHVSDGANSWEYLADFHNKVADAIKKVDPTTEVGGPSTAYMALEESDFKRAKDLLTFMDNTKEHLDYYSHHFYESATLIQNGNGYNTNGYLDGRLEAAFSLFENHMYLTDNYKPILITETGTLHDGPEDVDFWKMLKNYNAYMIRYINMTDSVDMLVPYLYGVKTWMPHAETTLYKYERGGLGEPTQMMNYLDMWSDYAGVFVPVKSNQRRVTTHAVLQGDKLYVAVNNTNPNRLNIDLNIKLGDAEIVDVSRKHIYFELGDLVYEDVKVEDISNVPMRVEETSIFEITLNKAPEFEEATFRKTYYGDKTLVETGEAPAEFRIECPKEDIEASILRIHFGKAGEGFSEDMNINFNGFKTLIDLSHVDQTGRLLTYVDVNIPTQYIKKTNTLDVRLPEKGGRISNVELTNDYKSTVPDSVDTLDLSVQTAIAMWTRDSITQELTTSTEKETYAALELAIDYANEVNDYTFVTQQELEKAEEALERTMEMTKRLLIK